MTDNFDIKKKLTDRFLRYISYDTASCDGAETIPSTKKQWELARLLKEELEQLGLHEVRLSENCYVYGVIPSNLECGDDSISLGFISHMDTVDTLPGICRPRIVEDYDGGDICLNEEKGIYLSVSDFPDMKELISKTLITTDGTTVLGADDKAGIAEIITMAEYLISNADIPHGRIAIGFTPDEEVGHGADLFDVEGFGAEFAFTVDGGPAGELEFENFNAAAAVMTVRGFGIHPGSAKGKMKNAALIAMELRSLLPEAEAPMYTEGYEGLYHITDITGDVETAKVSIIIRDHNAEHFSKRKELLRAAADFLNRKYGEGTVSLELHEQYRNMLEMIEPHMDMIELAKASMEELGIKPLIGPIRGGTDGARLSFMGLPCPNLGTGSRHHHGRYEIACLEDMELCTRLLIRICSKVVKKQ